MTSEDTFDSLRCIRRERLADWKAERERRIRAEQERDQARHERDSWRAQVPLADWEKELVQHSEQSRPLTPDAITGISYIDQPTLAAITNLGEALDTLSLAWPGHFDIDLTVKSSGEHIAAWHQEDGVTGWYFGHKEQS